MATRTLDTALAQANGLTKRFGRLPVLSSVDLAVWPGEVVGLIGPNGAGKTTLMECMAGLLPADSGTVTTTSNRSIAGSPSPATFFIPDGITPWEHRPVRWVLRLFQALHGTAADRAHALVEQLQLTPFLDQPVGELSRGQRKRVLLALGLLTASSLLMIDEPFEGLDLRQVRHTAALLREDAASGRGLLLSMHQLVDATRVCDRMVLLSGGIVVGSGTLDELRARAGMPQAQLEDLFLALT